MKYVSVKANIFRGKSYPQQVPLLLSKKLVFEDDEETFLKAASLFQKIDNAAFHGVACGELIDRRGKTGGAPDSPDDFARFVSAGADEIVSEFLELNDIGCFREKLFKLRVKQPA